ncbi:Uncharacterised protein [Vibrio cholerae]|nr:Uncharacterised protein [Vibrio cholerae]CSB41832.1 Uncharacterised protein [Vibrio cholerae]CSB80950.1 Uncharacterised protein [Vibrio cholerae]CSB93802.1 Uncharacterised protein [Vibrio cholerae]CSC41141.1 Uncharacterised protein [Vibrio cholerae]
MQGVQQLWRFNNPFKQITFFILEPQYFGKLTNNNRQRHPIKQT